MNAGPTYSIDGCKSIAAGGGIFIKHGRKQQPKKCSHEVYDEFAQRRGVCISHGAVVNYKQCRFEGCEKQAQGVCVMHGAIKQNMGLPILHSPSISNSTIKRGGGPKKCSVKGCNKISQASQGVCISHRAVVNYK